MTQTAIVQRLLPNNRAELLVIRESACGHNCEGCGGCSGAENSRLLISAENPVGAKPGDTVYLESQSKHVLGLAAVVYLLPFVFFFAGLFFASGVLGCSEGTSAVLGVAGAALGVVISVAVDRRLKRAGGLPFCITEVINRCSDM